MDVNSFGFNVCNVDFFSLMILLTTITFYAAQYTTEQQSALWSHAPIHHQFASYTYIHIRLFQTLHLIELSEYKKPKALARCV